MALCTYNADGDVNGGSLELTGLLAQLSQPAPDSVTDLASTSGFHMHVYTCTFTPAHVYTQITYVYTDKYANTPTRAHTHSDGWNGCVARQCDYSFRLTKAP